jgi:hypothetical protein
MTIPPLAAVLGQGYFFRRSGYKQTMGNFLSSRKDLPSPVKNIPHKQAQILRRFFPNAAIGASQTLYQSPGAGGP